MLAKEVLSLLRVSRQTLTKYVKAQKIKAVLEEKGDEDD